MVSFTDWVLPEIEFLLRVAALATGSAADAEQLVGATMLRARDSLATFDGQRPRKWLAETLQLVHHERATAALSDGPGAGAGAESNTSMSPDAMISIEIQIAIECMPPALRDALDLVDGQGVELAAVAAPTSPVDAVHRLRRRAVELEREP